MQRGVGDTYAQDPGIEPFAAEPMLSRTPAVAISLANSHGSRRPGSRNSPEKRTINGDVDGSVTVNSMTDKSELHINGNILGKLQVNSMNGGSRIRVSGAVWKFTARSC